MKIIILQIYNIMMSNQCIRGLIYEGINEKTGYETALRNSCNKYVVERINFHSDLEAAICLAAEMPAQ